MLLDPRANLRPGVPFLGEIKTECPLNRANRPRFGERPLTLSLKCRSRVRLTLIGRMGRCNGCRLLLGCPLQKFLTTAPQQKPEYWSHIVKLRALQPSTPGDSAQRLSANPEAIASLESQVGS